MMSNPKVTVVSISYNQEKYIGEMLRSIVAQETNFEFELLIADDNSTDGTPNIIRDFAKKYPHIVKPILRKKNVGAWNNITDVLKRAEGDYVALCEGDDYWIDSLKLQKQVDFLDKHESYAVCFHKAKIIYEESDKEDAVYPDVEDLKWYNLKELLAVNYIPTASVMYRRQDYADLADNMMPGDWYLHIYHAKFGKIKVIDEVMSVYRKHAGGIWWEYDVNRDAIWRKHGVSYVRLYTSFLQAVKHKPVEYTAIVRASINNTLYAIARVDEKFNGSQLDVVFERYPEYVRPFVTYMCAEYEQKSAESDEYKRELLKAGDERYEQEVRASRLEKELGDTNREFEKFKSEVTFLRWSKLRMSQLLASRNVKKKSK